MLSSEKQANHAVETGSEPAVSVVSNIHHPTIEWTAAEEAAVRRKLDWHIVPLTTLLYLLCFLDRANIGNARIQGLAVDLQLDGLKFNWALSAFYITYLLFEIPSNILLKRFGPRYYIPFLVAAFGLVSMYTAFVTSFAGLVVARAFLGVFEGGTMPGLAFMFSCFYKRDELMLRIGFFISSAGLAGAFGGLFINVTVQGLAVFLPTILADLQWSVTKAQLMTVPPNLAAAVCMVTMAYFSDKLQKRGPFLMLAAIIAVIGMAVLRWETQANIRYMGVVFAVAGSGTGGPAFLSWGINNAAGPSVRAVTSAYIVTLTTIGGLIATWTYLVRDAPQYSVGHSINFSGLIAVFCISLFGMLYCMWENKAREAGKRDYRLANVIEEEQANLGHDHPSFRYMI